MDEFDPSSADASPEHEAQIHCLQQMLDEGLEDLKAGRTISRAEMRRKIDAMFAEHAAQHSRSKCA